VDVVVVHGAFPIAYLGQAIAAQVVRVVEAIAVRTTSALGQQSPARVVREIGGGDHAHLIALGDCHRQVAVVVHIVQLQHDVADTGRVMSKQ
jgi:hypothetical protein